MSDNNTPLEFNTLRFTGKSFDECVINKLNPNPDEGGLFPQWTRLKSPM